MRCRGWLTRGRDLCFVWCLHGGVHVPLAGGSPATTSSALVQTEKPLDLNQEKSVFHAANGKRASSAGPKIERRKEEVPSVLVSGSYLVRWRSGKTAMIRRPTLRILA